MIELYANDKPYWALTEDEHVHWPDFIYIGEEETEFTGALGVYNNKDTCILTPELRDRILWLHEHLESADNIKELNYGHKTLEEWLDAHLGEQIFLAYR